jgi:peptide/nickel transport system substrate-binding protein
LVLAACGGGGSKGSSSPSGGSSSAGGSKNLTITGAVQVPATMDPDPLGATTLATPILQYMGQLFSYNGVDVKPTVTPADIKPDLAETATASADGLTWSIKLRSGVKSAAGNTLSTADIKWTFDRILAHKANALSALKRINVDVANPLTIKDAQNFDIHLTAQSPIFKDGLNGYTLGIFDSVDVKAHADASDPWGDKYLNTHSASFAPYYVTSYTPSQTMVYKANPSYWQGLPDVTTATFQTISDATQKLQAVLSGSVDLAQTLGTADKTQFTADSKATFQATSGGAMYYIMFDQTSTKMQNKAFRDAIGAAIDRTQLTKTAYFGLAKPLGSCTPSAWGPADTKTFKLTADIDKAKKDLASVPDKTFTLGIDGTRAELPDAARILQANLTAAGITVDIKTYASRSTFQADEAAHKLDAWYDGHFPATTDAGFWWATYFISTVPNNTIAYKDTTFDANVAKINSSTGDARKTLVEQSCKLFMDDLPLTPLLEVGTYTGVSKKMTNSQYYPDSAIRLYNLKAA